MLRLNKVCGTFAILLGGLFIGLFVPLSASAASAYDHLIQVTDNLKVGNNCNIVNYMAIIENEEYWLWDHSEAIADFKNALGTPGATWSVTNSVSQGNDSVINVSWTYSPGATVWTTSGVYATSTTNMRHLSIYNPSGDCETYEISDGLSNIAFDSVMLGNPNNNIHVFLTTHNMSYPQDYEGEIIPDTTNPIPSPEDLNMKLHWKVTDRDLEIKDISDYGLYTPEECWIQLPNNVQGDNFNEYIYNCNEPEWISHEMPDTYQQYTAIQFVRIDGEIVSKSYNIVIDGSSYDSEDDKVGAFEACFNTNISWSDPFPFDWNACVGNLAKVTNLLSFGQLKFGNNWEHESSCKELAVLDDWIGLENPNVCPMFNSTVRNTVTPFVTLVLGLITVGFVSRQTGGGFA